MLKVSAFYLEKKKVLFLKKKNFGRCQYQNKKALFTDSIFREGFGVYVIHCAAYEIKLIFIFVS